MAETPESSVKWAAQGVPRAENVSREHGKISLSEAALGRGGARFVHAGAAGEKDCPEQDTDQSISSRLEEKCFTWNICFEKYTANVGQWQWNGGQGKREILEENERLLI